MSKLPKDDFDEGAMFTPQATAVHPAMPQGNFPPPGFMPLAQGQMPTMDAQRDFEAKAAAWAAANPQAYAAPVDPLAKFYRMPGLHVRLPTGGAFLPPGAIEMTQAGDVPVYPMRGADELLLKNPDALMSGYAVQKLLESCVPAIKTPRLVSTPDLDVLLLAIRAATHGENMGLAATCPKCETVSEFDCNLPTLLATMKTIEPENPVRLSDEVVVYVRPVNIESATTIALCSFDEARRLQAIDAQKPDSMTRATEMSRTMTTVGMMTKKVIGDCITKVVVPGDEVTDPESISKFYQNVAKPWADKIDKKVRSFSDLGIDKHVTVRCNNKACKHEWTTEVEFDPATFFDVSSLP